MGIKFANNARTGATAAIASSLTAFDTTTTPIPLVDWEQFPVVANGSGDFFYLTLTDSQGMVYEIVRVTRRDTTNWVWERAQDGTTAQNWPLGSVLEHRLNAGALDVLSSAEPAIAAGATTQYIRGDKSLENFASAVRAALLTGLSTTSATIVTATHTVLQAVGFLQKQVTDNKTLSDATDTSLQGQINNRITYGDVQSSKIDNNPDKLMLVGAFGLGRTDIPVVANLNTLQGTYAGFSFDNTATGAPAGGVYGAVGWQVQSGGQRTQFASLDASQKLLVRIDDSTGGAGAFGAWEAISGVAGGLRNKIINGDMRIDQRNNGAQVVCPAGDARFTVDRMGYSQSAVNVVAQQANTPVGSAPYLAGLRKCLTFTTTSPRTSAASDYHVAYTWLEGHTVADLMFGTAVAKTFTLSFYVAVSTAGTYSFRLGNTNVDRCYIFTKVLAAGWQLVTQTVVGDTTGVWNTDTGGGLLLSFDLGAGTSFEIGITNSWQVTSARRITGSVRLCTINGATLSITGVQLEAGLAATPFEHRPYGLELSLCQRYFWKDNTGFRRFANVATASYAGAEMAHSLGFPVTMRASPTVITNTSISNITVTTNTGPDAITFKCNPSAANQYLYVESGTAVSAEL